MDLDQSWMTSDGLKAISEGAAAWRRERQALLPGITTRDRLVGEGRKTADRRLSAQLTQQLPAAYGTDPRIAASTLPTVAHPPRNRHYSQTPLRTMRPRPEECRRDMTRPASVTPTARRCGGSRALQRDEDLGAVSGALIGDDPAWTAARNTALVRSVKR